MKKILLFALVLFFIGGALFAQDAQTQEQQTQERTSKYKESEYYYYNVPIEKIYAYRLGYVVLYRKGVNKMTRTYLPSNWFTDIGGKGEMVGLGSGKEWPSMTVYYKGGEFSHVRLRVRRERAHESWGVVPLSVNIDEMFEGIEEVQLEF